MSEDPVFYNQPPDLPALAQKGAIIARELETAIPLRAEHAAAFGAGLARFCAATGRTVESITLGEIAELARQPGQGRGAGPWFALGKIGGAWYAVAPATALDPAPLTAVIRGHRRRLLRPQDIAQARRFGSKEEARAAGRAVFTRTFTLHQSQLAND